MSRATSGISVPSILIALPSYKLGAVLSLLVNEIIKRQDSALLPARVQSRLWQALESIFSLLSGLLNGIIPLCLRGASPLLVEK